MKEIEVIYEDGVFKPLKKVEFREGERVVVVTEKREERLKEVLERMKTFKPISMKFERLEEIYIESNRY